jgi:hypothetical protein
MKAFKKVTIALCVFLVVVFSAVGTASAMYYPVVSIESGTMVFSIITDESITLTDMEWTATYADGNTFTGYGNEFIIPIIEGQDLILELEGITTTGEPFACEAVVTEEMAIEGTEAEGEESEDVTTGEVATDETTSEVQILYIS